jgi:hypothetical protein
VPDVDVDVSLEGCGEGSTPKGGGEFGIHLTKTKKMETRGSGISCPEKDS